MARLREYTPARRLVMQVLMWVIFAATYAGAVALVHARSESLRISLTPMMIDGDLLYRLPAGWLSERNTRQGLLITATEPAGSDRVPRKLQIEAFLHIPGPVTANEIMARLPERPIHVHPLAFKGLGQGVAWETRRGILENDEEERIVPPKLFACVVAPRSRHSTESVVIIIDLEGPTTFGPSSVKLLQMIADSLAVAPNATTAQSVSPSGNVMAAGG